MKIAKLKKLEKHLRAQKTLFYMPNWLTRLTGYEPPDALPNVCGTAGCIAGHAVLLAGYKPVFFSDDEDLQWEDSYKCKKGQKEYDVENLAQDELGLTRDQAYWLFNGYWLNMDSDSDTDRPLETIRKAEAADAVAALLKARGNTKKATGLMRAKGY